MVLPELSIVRVTCESVYRSKSPTTQNTCSFSPEGVDVTSMRSWRHGQVPEDVARGRVEVDVDASVEYCLGGGAFEDGKRARARRSLLEHS